MRNVVTLGEVGQHKGYPGIASAHTRLQALPSSIRESEDPLFLGLRLLPKKQKATKMEVEIPWKLFYLRSYREPSDSRVHKLDPPAPHRVWTVAIMVSKHSLATVPTSS